MEEQNGQLDTIYSFTRRMPFCSLRLISPACSFLFRKAFQFVTKASMLAEFFFALAMLWWEGLRALKIDISS